jgi:predicted membrane protein
MFNFGILGGSKLGKRAWKPGKKLTTISLLGGTDIDFQQAELEEPVTKVVCISILGGTNIIVPPNIPVTFTGVSLLGGRDMKLAESDPAVQASDKSLHINAIAILGGISIKGPKKS